MPLLATDLRSKSTLKIQHALDQLPVAQQISMLIHVLQTPAAVGEVAHDPASMA